MNEREFLDGLCDFLRDNIDKGAPSFVLPANYSRELLGYIQRLRMRADGVQIAKEGDAPNP